MSIATADNKVADDKVADDKVANHRGAGAARREIVVLTGRSNAKQAHHGWAHL
jgi:hypothetical protein